MRLLIAGLIMALMVASAQAQMTPQSAAIQGAQGIGQQAGRTAHTSTDDGPKVKANDKAYDAALKNLPDKQYDPWRGVR
jgi:hypothetical protein